MSRKSKDYKKTRIYKLVCNDPNCNEVYVGSTTGWRSRRNNHKSKSQNPKCKEYDYKVYRAMRETGGWGNWSMIELEHYPCKNIREQKARERHWVEALNATLNVNIPGGMTKEEIRQKQQAEYTCICGKTMQYNNQYKHRRTSKVHRKFLEEFGLAD